MQTKNQNLWIYVAIAIVIVAASAVYLYTTANQRYEIKVVIASPQQPLQIYPYENATTPRHNRRERSVIRRIRTHSQPVPEQFTL